MLRIFILVFGFVISIFSVANAQNYDNNVRVFTIEDDKFSKSASFVGIVNHIKGAYYGTSTDWLIRGFVNKETKDVTYQLYVETSYVGDWHFYEWAADDSAKNLAVVSIATKTGSCQYQKGCWLKETIGISLDENKLKEKALAGFQIKVTGRSGLSFIMDITPAQIQSALITANQLLPEAKKWQSPIAINVDTNAPKVADSSKTTSNSIIPIMENYGSWGYGQDVIVEHTMTKQAAIEFAKSELVSQGWLIRSATENTIVTEAKSIKANGTDADCGSMFGIPYLVDKRVTTIAYMTLSFDGNKIIIKPAIAGTMKVGNSPFGDMGYKTLSCNYKGDKLFSQIVVSFKGK